MSATASGVYEIPQDFVDFRDTIRQMVVERVAPRAAEIDAADEYPWDIRELFASHDLLGLPFGEEHGGTGTGTLMLQIAVEEVAKASAACALILMIQELGSLPITLFGTDEQKARWLPSLASGEQSPAFCLSEPEAGSDAGATRTTAVRDGDEWVINGTKNWITNAGVADLYVVFALTDREARRVTAFVVEKDRDGLLGSPNYEHKLGIHGSPTGQPVFEDVRVPDANRARRGRPGDARRARPPWSARGSAPPRRPSGSLRARPTTPTKYAKERTTFGRPIFEHQAIAFKLADMETKHRRGARAALQGLRAGRPQRPAAGQVQLDGQAVRLRRGDVGDRRGRAGARRLRLRDRVPRRAHDARREDHADLRRDQRDPAHGDLPGAG